MLVLFAFAVLLFLYDLMTAGTYSPTQQKYTPPDTSSLSPTKRSFFLNQPMAINKATVEDLALLPGIGQALAERIYRFRMANGPYRNRSDLERIPGIGPKMSGNISRYVHFEEL